MIQFSEKKGYRARFANGSEAVRKVRHSAIGFEEGGGGMGATTLAELSFSRLQVSKQNIYVEIIRKLRSLTLQNRSSEETHRTSTDLLCIDRPLNNPNQILCIYRSLENPKWFHVYYYYFYYE
jgi:hypothetical protein